MTIKAGVAEFTEGENVGITCDKAKLACDSIKHEFGKSIEYYSVYLSNLQRKYMKQLPDTAVISYSYIQNMNTPVP